jgi:hypothetical protein
MMRRRSIPTLVLFGSIAAGLTMLAACSSSGGALGSSCLRSDDCAVGVCSALQCRLPPTDPNARASGGTNALAAPAIDAGVAQDAGAVDVDAADTAADASPEQG